jgi:uncharacterized protein (DUF1330 family)
MPAYVIVDIEVTDPALYEDYKKLSSGAVAAYGGKFLARGGQTFCLEGGWDAQRIVVIEFSSPDQARAWWESPEYAPAKDLRFRSARTRMLVVEGVPQV